MPILEYNAAIATMALAAFATRKPGMLLYEAHAPLCKRLNLAVPFPPVNLFFYWFPLMQNA